MNDLNKALERFGATCAKMAPTYREACEAISKALSNDPAGQGMLPADAAEDRLYKKRGYGIEEIVAY